MRVPNFLLTVLCAVLLTACAQQDFPQPELLDTNNQNTNNNPVSLTSDDVLDIELYVLLEGPYRINVEFMRTDLNMERGLLPGQTLIGLGTSTPAWQPYTESPWNFDEEIQSLAFTNYPPDVVDWLLVSFRTDITSDTEVAKTTAYLHSDGRITFPNLENIQAIAEEEAVYIVVEHRNHMGVMTPEPIDVIEGAVVYDFSQEDSYRVSTSYGQKQMPSGKWVMIAGDVDQASDDFSYDVNAYDKVDWVEDNGTFGQYKISDLNLDGDVSMLDKSLWVANNGKLSAVPK